MIYLIAAVTAAMLVYMGWLVVFRLRHDRVKTERAVTRGKYAFRPKERLRFLLGRSFDVSQDKPEWEDSLVSSLNTVPREVAEPVAEPAALPGSTRSDIQA